MAQLEVVASKRWRCTHCRCLYLGSWCPHCRLADRHRHTGDAEMGDWWRFMYVVPQDIQPVNMVDRGVVLQESFNDGLILWQP